MAWVKSKPIGDGGQGDVFLATRHGYAPLAVKSAGIWDAEELQLEAEYLSLFRDSSEIVTCFGQDISMEKGKRTYNLLLELAPGGSLQDLIDRAGGRLPENEARKYTYMILTGLACIHERNFVHCDIKPKNILVFPSDDGQSNKVKISDFGMAKPKDGDDVVYQLEEKMDRYRGTPQYLSPEAVAYGMNESPLDIWGLGCTVLEMFTGKVPWRLRYKKELLYEIGFSTELPAIPEDISEAAKDFLTLCFQRDYKKRPTAKQLLEHPFALNAKDLSPAADSSVAPIEPIPWISERGMFEVDGKVTASTKFLKRRSYAQVLISAQSLRIEAC